MAIGKKDVVPGDARRTASPGRGIGISTNAQPDGENSTPVYRISSRRYRAFAEGLRGVSAALDLPEPLRSRVILEIAEDLESLAAEYRAAGMEEDEASARAQERLLVSPEAMRALVRLHTSGVERLISRLAAHLRTGFDALLFSAATLPFLLASALVVAGEFRDALADPLLWPLLFGALALLATAAGSVRAIRRRSRPPAAIRRVVFSLLPLAATIVAIGLFGFFWKVYAVTQRLGSGSPADLTPVVAHLVTGASMLAFGLLLAIAAGFAYVLLVNRVARIERLECAALFGN